MIKNSTAKVIVIGIIAIVFVWIGFIIFVQYQDLNEIESHVVRRGCFVNDGIQLSLHPSKEYSMNRLNFGHTSIENGTWSAADPYRFGRRLHFMLSLTSASHASTKQDAERVLDVVIARDGGGYYLEMEDEKWYESACVTPETYAKIKRAGIDV